MQQGDKALPSNNPVGHAPMLITLKQHWLFDPIWNTYTFEQCIDTGMQNDSEGLPSISLVSCGHLVKMLIRINVISNGSTLKPENIIAIIVRTLWFVRRWVPLLT